MIEIGRKLKTKYPDCVVLELEFMHGDADEYTFVTLAAKMTSPDALELVRDVYNYYKPKRSRHAKKVEPFVHKGISYELGPMRLDDLCYCEGECDCEDPYEDVTFDFPEGLETTASEACDIFPWDRVQASIDMYENRAQIESLNLYYVGFDGSRFEVSFK